MMPTVVMCCIATTLPKAFRLAFHIVQYDLVCVLDVGPQVTTAPYACGGVTHFLANCSSRQNGETVITNRSNLVEDIFSMCVAKKTKQWLAMEEKYVHFEKWEGRYKTSRFFRPFVTLPTKRFMKEHAF